MKKKAGILGGMGPEATIHLLKLIVQLTDASRDQDHVTTVVLNNPMIPDRTAAILGTGESPLPFLIDGAHRLANAGADFIAIPCMTSFHFYNDLIPKVSIPIIHLLEQIILYIKKNYPGMRKVGVIATDGTIRSGVFQSLFTKNEIVMTIPSEVGQKQFMSALYNEKGIKAGYKKGPKQELLSIIDGMLAQDAPDAIIAGCTEIPLVVQPSDIDVPFIDPLLILAEEIIVRAGYSIRNIQGLE